MRSIRFRRLVGGNNPGIHHRINVSATDNAADALASEVLRMGQERTNCQSTRGFDFEIDSTETVAHRLQGEAVWHFKNIGYTASKYLPVEFAKTQCSRTISNRRWLLLVTDQLPAMKRKNCIITRKWLCTNNLCLCV